MLSRLLIVLPPSPPKKSNNAVLAAPRCHSACCYVAHYVGSLERTVTPQRSRAGQ